GEPAASAAGWGTKCPHPAADAAGSPRSTNAVNIVSARRRGIGSFWRGRATAVYGAVAHTTLIRCRPCRGRRSHTGPAAAPARPHLHGDSARTRKPSLSFTRSD